MRSTSFVEIESDILFIAAQSEEVAHEYEESR